MSELKNNVVGWFEIPVLDMKRAMKFYQEILGYEMSYHDMGELEMGWFPAAGLTGAPGSLMRHKEFYKPSADGTLVYFNSPSSDLANELAKVEKAGGKLLMDKKLISADVGYMGLFLDTEGNRIALHSKQ